MQHATTSSELTISPSSSLHQSACGCALMSPRPNSTSLAMGLDWPSWQAGNMIWGRPMQPITPGRNLTTKTYFAVGLGMLAGVSFGAVASQSLYAQAKPPVYLITEIDPKDPEKYAAEFA